MALIKDPIKYKYFLDVTHYICMENFKLLTAEEAAAFVNHDDVVGFSGFTAAGCPKIVPQAIARRAKVAHEAGEEFQIKIYTGASTGDSIDGELARAHAVKFRVPYQSNKDLRNAINKGEVEYTDLHLSTLPQNLRYGFAKRPKFAILEVADYNGAGEIVLTAGVGISPTLADLADYVILEHNSYHPKSLKGIHDLYQPADPPTRREVPIYKPSDRIGTTVLQIDPKKIIGVVKNNMPDENSGFAPVDGVTKQIGENVAKFLATELKEGRLPKEFAPIQSGVGNIANALLTSLGSNPDIPPFKMYTEVIQDSVIKLMREGQITFASGCSLTVSNEVLQEIYADLDFFKDKLVLRPQELSNSPEVVRRLGLVTINTALEVDIFGNVNSTHVMGEKMMNGIGGSGDFTRNAFVSIFTTPSTAKNGDISAIVPMVAHNDHSEHSVKVIITEHGIADLRRSTPTKRAELIIENCVAPEYRGMLREYVKNGSKNYTPIDLKNSFAMHKAFLKTGSMKNTEWEK